MSDAQVGHWGKYYENLLAAFYEYHQILAKFGLKQPCINLSQIMIHGNVSDPSHR